MCPYEILSLTEDFKKPADLRIKATGDTKEEAFSETLRGLFENCGPEFEFVKKEAEKITRKVEIKSANLNNMLVEFLNEAIYFSDEENSAYMIAEFEKLTDTELKATIFGQKVVKFHKPVKSASYHGTIIKEKDGKWEAVARFEI
jgi:SHS2 domain-containing protein